MKTLIKKLSLVGGLLSWPVLVMAQTPTAPDVPAQVPINTAADLVNVIDNISGFVTTILIAITILLILYAAYLYLTGSEDNIKKAKTQLIYIAVGVALILISESIVPLVSAILR